MSHLKIIRHTIKTTIKTIGQSKFATFIDAHMKIPQDYSFIIFGTHGVGFHSLLYYLSLCYTKDKTQVYPMPLHIFSKSFDLFGHFTVGRFYKKMYPILKSNKYVWGLTFDGGIPRNPVWVKHNVTRKVPAIMLVRDPLSTLTTTFNYEIFCKLQSNLEIDYDYIYGYVMRYFTSACGFKHNLEHMDNTYTELLYVDCSGLTGDSTYPTMQKVAHFLNLDISYQESLNYSINSTFQRYFSAPILFNGEEFYLSSFPEFFRITSYPNYFAPNYCDNLGFLHYQAYNSPQFQQHTFYLFSKSKTQITENLRQNIENYLYHLAQIQQQYEQLKIDSDFFIQLVKKHSDYALLKTKLLEQCCNIPEDIIKNWKYYLTFISEQ